MLLLLFFDPKVSRLLITDYDYGTDGVVHWRIFFLIRFGIEEVMKFVILIRKQKDRINDNKNEQIEIEQQIEGKKKRRKRSTMYTPKFHMIQTEEKKNNE